MPSPTTFAASSYAALRPNIAPNQGAALPQMAQDFAATLQAGETAAKSALVAEYDPHSFVTALAQTELAVETAITVRDKVVEAYQEILRMPV